MTPVNDAPSFTKGADETVIRTPVAHTVLGWATDIYHGVSDEGLQTLTFTVSDDNGLFASQPAISPSGDLTFTGAPGAHGIATLTVTLKDDGGTANGGFDTSSRAADLHGHRHVGQRAPGRDG